MSRQNFTFETGVPHYDLILAVIEQARIDIEAGYNPYRDRRVPKSEKSLIVNPAEFIDSWLK